MERYLLRRSRLEISAEILQACKCPIAKTRLMQKLNLSYNTMQSCLAQLAELGLIEMQPDTLEYVVSRRGLAYLVQWKQLQAFLKPDEKLSLKLGRITQVSVK